MSDDVQILVGDCRAVLGTLAAGSVQACITSPPYYGLRAYGTDPLVWGGDPSCDHVWGVTVQQPRHADDGITGSTLGGGKATQAQAQRTPITTGTCRYCGAWRGELGQEPTLDCVGWATGAECGCCYVCHLLEVFRAVRRVLRPDGTLWLNLGDSYSNAGQAGGDRRAGKTGQWSVGQVAGCAHPPAERVPVSDGTLVCALCAARYTPGGGKARYTPIPAGLGEKQLLGVPSRVYLALQADGWTARSFFPWLKVNAMPESVTDRPTLAHEWWLMLTPGPRYYWNADAIRQTISVSTVERWGALPPPRTGQQQAGISASAQSIRGENFLGINANGRNYRTTDPWFTSAAAIIADLTRHVTDGGLLLDSDGLPIGVNQPTRSYKGAHFATFPLELIEPFIKAGTSGAGQCPACGAPWVRMVERGERVLPETLTPKTQERLATGIHGANPGTHEPGWRKRPARPSTASEWHPSCTCNAGDPVPQTVLDPFGGTGVVASGAVKWGRRAIICELNPTYAELARARIGGTQPALFTEDVA